MGSAASVLLKAQVENAKKTGVLVFTNQGYQYIPPQVTSTQHHTDSAEAQHNTHTQVLNLRHGLRLLDMSANKIAQIPERVAGLRCQQADNWCLHLFVDLDQQNVLNISRNLKSLFLNQNRLTSLPTELGDMTFPRHLTHGNFMSISGSLVRLELLSLSYNFISNLPPTISLLTNLR